MWKSYISPTLFFCSKSHLFSHLLPAGRSRVNMVYPACTAETWHNFFPFLLPCTQVHSQMELRDMTCWVREPEAKEPSSGQPCLLSQLFHDACVLYIVQEMQQLVNIIGLDNSRTTVIRLAYRSDNYGQLNFVLVRPTGNCGIRQYQTNKTETQGFHGQNARKNNLGTKQPANMHFILLKLRQYVTIISKCHLQFELFYSLSYNNERTGILAVPLWP